MAYRSHIIYHLHTMMNQYYFYNINTDLQLFGKEMIQMFLGSDITGTCKGENYISALCHALLARVCMVYLVLVP